MSLPFEGMTARRELPLLIVFIDFTRYTARVTRLPDEAVADEMDRYYERVWSAAISGGGRVVKFIGDGALLLFPEERVDDAVITLLRLKDECEAWFADIGWDSELIVKAHFGTAVAGPFGPRAHRHFDAIGANVNIAATMSTRSFALSAEAFRKLRPATRTQFKKHTPPVTYIRAADRHPHRTGRAV